MQRLRAQGKVGPEFGKMGGRPSKKARAADFLAAEAEKHGKEMLSALKDALDPSQNVSTRLKAVEQWLKIEDTSRRAEIEEEKHFAEMSRDELMEQFARKLNENPMLKQLFLDNMRGPAQVPDLTELPEGDDDDSD